MGEKLDLKSKTDFISYVEETLIKNKDNLDFAQDIFKVLSTVNRLAWSFAGELKYVVKKQIINELRNSSLGDEFLSNGKKVRNGSLSSVLQLNSDTPFSNRRNISKVNIMIDKLVELSTSISFILWVATGYEHFFKKGSELKINRASIKEDLLSNQDLDPTALIILRSLLSVNKGDTVEKKNKLMLIYNDLNKIVNKEIIVNYYLEEGSPIAASTTPVRLQKAILDLKNTKASIKNGDLKKAKENAAVLSSLIESTKVQCHGLSTDLEIAKMFKHRALVNANIDRINNLNPRSSIHPSVKPETARLLENKIATLESLNQKLQAYDEEDYKDVNRIERDLNSAKSKLTHAMNEQMKVSEILTENEDKVTLLEQNISNKLASLRPIAVELMEALENNLSLYFQRKIRNNLTNKNSSW